MAGPYFVKSGTGGDDSGSSWANAAESLKGLLATATVAGGEIVYVHNTHNFTGDGTSITLTLPESGTGVLQILSVDGGDATGASLSGTTVGNLYAGASEGTGGNFSWTINMAAGATGLYVYGLTFTAGAAGSSSGADINLFQTNVGGTATFDKCTFYINSTSVSATMTIGSSTTHANVKFLNCLFRHAATNPTFINLDALSITFENCAIHADSTTIATMFVGSGGRQANTLCMGCDWTKATNLYAQTGSGRHYFRAINCVIGTPITGTHPGLNGPISEFHACGAASGTLVIDYYYEDACGVVQDSQATAGYYLTSGGAEAKDDDGNTVKYSLAMTPTANATAFVPLYTPWFYTNVATTGDKTVAVKVATATTALKENEVWLEVEYMGEPGLAGTQRVADSPQTVREFDDLCNLVSGTLSRDVTVTGDDRTDTTDAWTYNGSDWAAAVAHTLTASINIAEQGYIRCRVGLAKDQDTYVDPKVTVA